MTNIDTLERKLLKLNIKLDKLFFNFEEFSLTAPEISWTAIYIEHQIGKAIVCFKHKEQQQLIDYNILVNQINVRYIQEDQRTNTIPITPQILRNKAILFSVNEYIDMNKYIHRNIKNIKIIIKNDKIEAAIVPLNTISLTTIEKIEQHRQILLKTGKQIHDNIVVIIADIFRKYPGLSHSRIRINNIIYNQLINIYNNPKKIIIAKLKLEKSDLELKEQIKKLEELNNIDFKILAKPIAIKLLEKRKPEIEIIKEILCNHIKIYQNEINSKGKILVNNFNNILQYKINKIDAEYASILNNLNNILNNNIYFNALNEFDTMIVLVARKLALEREKKQINWSILYFQNETKTSYPGNAAKLSETTKEYTKLYQPLINYNMLKYLELI